MVLNLRKRLKSQSETMEKYCEKLEKAIQEGHLIPAQGPRDTLVSRRSLSLSNDFPRYYIPHFHTSRTKFRVVYDAARKFQGLSLNEFLYRGPIFMQSLQSILIRFGEMRYRQWHFQYAFSNSYTS